MPDKPVKLTKKQLKATAFRTRKKAKEILEELNPFPEADEDEPATSQAIKPGPSKKKRKRGEDDPAGATTEEVDAGAEDGDGDEPLCAAAKRRKRKKAALARKFEENKAAKASKLILFIGNLPFDITADRLKSFFLEHCGESSIPRKKNPPNHVRLRS